MVAAVGGKKEMENMVLAIREVLQGFWYIRIFWFGFQDPLKFVSCPFPPTYSHLHIQPPVIYPSQCLTNLTHHSYLRAVLAPTSHSTYSMQL